MKCGLQQAAPTAAWGNEGEAEAEEMRRWKHGSRGVSTESFKKKKEKKKERVRHALYSPLAHQFKHCQKGRKKESVRTKYLFMHWFIHSAGSDHDVISASHYWLMRTVN